MTVRATVRAAWPVCVGAALAIALASAGAAHSARAGGEPVARDACGVPVDGLAWIDYGEGSVQPDVRAVLARPGVIVSSSGTGVPADFRRRGAATSYWVLHLDRLIGEPATPADPASIPATAAKLLAQAQASAACATPWIALNELLGASAQQPWSATTAQYRADLLALVQQLAAGGAHPAVLVHGDPTVAGTTVAAWWRQLAASAAIVYEAYYDASRIYPMGAVMGNRRMRMGIDNVVTLFESIGIRPARLGVMLGFHSAQTPGIAGRQGLQPREAWLRVVKWEALAAREVAQRRHLSSVWSWGWGTFGADSVDPDKAAAACVYLWARDAALCGAPGVAGPELNTSLVEGQIVIPPGSACTFAGGHVWQAAVDRLATLTRDPHEALTALFARAALSRVAEVTSPQVLAVERAVISRSFHGSRQAYVTALGRRQATVAIARGVIADELRRRAIAADLEQTESTQTTFETTTGRESQLVTTAICADDALPGSGNFPASDARDVGVVPLPARLPFLFGDRTPPAAPSAPQAAANAKGVTLTWQSGREADLAGYDVYRSLAGGAYTKLNSATVPRLDFLAPKVPAGQTAAYLVRAVDTSGNRSAASAAVTVTGS